MTIDKGKWRGHRHVGNYKKCFEFGYGHTKLLGVEHLTPFIHLIQWVIVGKQSMQILKKTKEEEEEEESLSRGEWIFCDWKFGQVP